MPDRPRVRLGNVRRRVQDDGSVKFTLALSRAKLEDACRYAEAEGWVLVGLSVFPVTRGKDPELAMYLERRHPGDFELEGGDR